MKMAEMDLKRNRIFFVTVLLLCIVGFYSVCMCKMSFAGKKDINDSSSESSLIEDVETISDALGKVTNLRGVTWVWKDKERDNRVQMGLVAQEVEKVVPEVVSSGADGKKTVAYTQLIGLLIESIKDLNAENDAIKDEYANIKNDNIFLKSENEQLVQELLALKERQDIIEHSLRTLSSNIPRGFQ